MSKAKTKKILTPEEKQKRIRNIIIVIVILVLSTIGMFWTMPQNNALSESKVFDEDAVRQQAEDVIDFLNAEDYDSLAAMSVAKLQEIMNQERMEEGKARVSDDWGNFVSIESIQDIELVKRGTHTAVVYVTAKYDNVEAHFTLAFNEELKLVSFGIQ